MTFVFEISWSRSGSNSTWGQGERKNERAGRLHSTSPQGISLTQAREGTRNPLKGDETVACRPRSGKVFVVGVAR